MLCDESRLFVELSRKFTVLTLKEQAGVCLCCEQLNCSFSASPGVVLGCGTVSVMVAVVA